MAAQEPVTTTIVGDHDEGAEHGLLTTIRWVHPQGGQVSIAGSAPLILGRDPDLPTPLDGAQVSRRHAELTVAAGQVVLRDLGSKNGVFVDGQRVERAVLGPGRVVRLGDCVGVVEQVSPMGLAGPSELSPGIFGGSALRALVERARQAARSELNLVVIGETGTGKECFARALHGWSRRVGEFLAVNCAVYTDQTATAELFGYRRGAFTGAEQASVGHLRAAHRGTLFLDEVLELPPESQAKLLRAIEQKEVLPLGETRPVSVDVRFVSASQAALADAVAAGSFRQDLRARLEGVVLELPPLRARRADVVPLFEFLLARHGGSSPPRLDALAAERLARHDWPMNVRELENVARRILGFHAHEPVVRLRHLDDVLVPAVAITPPASGELARPAPYSPSELEQLLCALERHRGNVTRAAAELGITRPKAYRMLRTARGE